MANLNSELLIKLKAQYEDASLKTLNKDLRELKQNTNATEKATQDYATKVNYLTGQIQKQNQATKDASVSTKKSSAQFLEMGENLTVVANGIMQVVQQLKKYATELWNISKAGAEFGVIKEGFVELSGGIEYAEKDLQLFRTALAGNFNDKQIIEFANKMKELGYLTNQTAKIFDISERASDKFGGSIDRANDVLLRFFETGKGKGLYNFGIDIGAVNEKMVELSGLTEEQIKKLSSEEQQILRTEATLQLYGKTLQDIGNKTKDNADKMAVLESALDNLALAFGKSFSDEIIKKVEGVSKGLDDLGIKMGDTNKNAISLGDAFGKALGMITPFALGGVWGIIISNLNKVTDAIKGVINIFRNWNPEVLNSIKTNLNTFFNWIIDNVKSVIGWLQKIGFIPEKPKDYEKSTIYPEAIGPEPPPEKDGNNLSNTTKSISNIEEQNDEIEKLDQKIKTLEADIVEATKKYGDMSGYVIKLTKQLDKLIEDKNNLLHIYGRPPMYIDDMDKRSMIVEAYSDLEIKKIERPITYKDPFEEAVRMFQEKRIKLFQEQMDNLLNVANNIVNVFNIGAHTFISKLVNGLNDALSIADSIVKLLASLGMMAADTASGGFFGFLGSILGFASGGYISGAGTGTSDSILARLSNGEFVINAQATRKFLPLLQAINNGNNVKNATKYADGGLVKRFANNTINLAVADVKIKGSDLYLSWRRQGRLENNRKG